MKQEHEISYWAVAFIDLLGQSDKMEQLTYIPDSAETNSQFKSLIGKTFLAVEKLHTSCESMFQSFCDREPSIELPQGFSLEQYHQCIRSKISFQRFSDGLVAFVSMKPDSGHLPMNSLSGLLGSLGILMPAFLSMEIPFRCGVEVGLGMEMNPGELYGPALRSAYLLESTIAQYPRIVLGDSLISYAKKSAASDGGSVDDAISHTLASRLLERCSVDADGYVVLDYLGEKFISDLQGLEDKKQVMGKAYEFALAEHTRFRKLKNSKLAFRYATLLSYFETNRSNWDQ